MNYLLALSVERDAFEAINEIEAWELGKKNDNACTLKLINRLVNDVGIARPPILPPAFRRRYAQTHTAYDVRLQGAMYQRLTPSVRRKSARAHAVAQMLHRLERLSADSGPEHRAACLDFLTAIIEACKTRDVRLRAA